MKNRPILFSLKPNYADLIFDGVKTVELRRRAGNIAYREAFIYVSSPNRILKGGFKIGAILSDHPEELWEKVSARAGISEDAFHSYFAGKNKAFALEIQGVWEYERPKDLIHLRDQYPGFVVPQSYRQISTKEEQSWTRLKKLSRSSPNQNNRILAGKS